MEGTYYLNRLFATVEMIPKTIIEVGTWAWWFPIPARSARTYPAVDYRHGELVEKGNRGVWSEPLLPGKYAFNTYAGKVDDRPDHQHHPQVDPERDRRRITTMRT